MAMNEDIESGNLDLESLTSDDTIDDTYAACAARTAGLRFVVGPSRRVENDIPSRPCTALFTPHAFTPAHAVLDALDRLDMPEDALKCMQRKQNGEVLITFKTEAFVRQNTLTVDDEVLAIQDVDRLLVFVTIFDAPHEMPDLVLINRLSDLCEVIHSRCGKFSFRQSVFNGLRHFRVRLLKPIPSFLRFGRILVRVKYDGQKPTCRCCGDPDHVADVCPQIVCFNCEELGHEVGHCPRPRR